jgi:hypothetical protein
MTELMVAARITDALKQRCAYQTDPHRRRHQQGNRLDVRDGPHKQLCDLDGASENQQEDRKQTESTFVARPTASPELQ